MRGVFAMTPEQLRADPWAFGPWCWVVDRVESFGGDPRPCRGMQGLWPIGHGELRDALFDLVGMDVRWGLTLLQPYASAIIAGPKRVENRPWRRMIPDNGLWVGLHAGKTLYGGPDAAEDMLDEWRDGPCSLLPDTPHWPKAPCVAELPLGCMLGAVHIRQILRYSDECSP